MIGALKSWYYSIRADSRNIVMEFYGLKKPTSVKDKEAWKTACKAELERLLNLIGLVNFKFTNSPINNMSNLYLFTQLLIVAF